jgi:hypothetical protein
LAGVENRFSYPSRSPGRDQAEEEFQDLRQGSMLLNEYVTHFTQLSRFAPNDVDTDEKKQDYFLNRLNDG